MIIRKFWIALIAVAFLAGCSDDDEPRTGTYRYTGFLNNNAVVEGVIHLDGLTNNTVSGRWDLNFAGAANNEVGPQIGTGTLAGSIDAGAINVNLNPGVADNNVFLQGTFQDETIRGQWNWSGFPGVISQGTFLAERQ